MGRVITFGDCSAPLRTRKDRQVEFADPARRSFATTHWSLVLEAAGSGPGARDALGRLCGAYWEAVYFFLRGQGRDPEEAMDLTQGFLARLLEKRDLGGVSPTRGRFRAFLLGALRHFLSNERDKARAQKRGGGELPLSLDFVAAEGHFSREPTDLQGPERLYERRWALATVARAMDALEKEMAAAGKAALFAKLKDRLAGGDAPAHHAAVAAELGMTEAAIKMAMSRLKKRYRDTLRALIAETVVDPRQVDEEIGHLIAALGPS